MLSNFVFGIIAVPGFSPPIPAATTLSPLFYPDLMMTMLLILS